MSVSNNSGKSLSIREIALFDFQHELPGDTDIYEEVFQNYPKWVERSESRRIWEPTDRNYYKIPEPENMRAAYGMLTLQLPHGLPATCRNSGISRIYVHYYS